MKKNIKTDRKQVKILGIEVDSTTRSRLLRAVEDKISHNSKFYIVTPNSELILASTRDKKLKVALNSADFSVPDSVGLKLADFSLRIIKGRILFIDLVKLAHKKSWKLFFLGGLDNEAEIVAKKLGAAFAAGPRLDLLGEPIDKSEARIEAYSIRKINEYKPDLLFVAFGNPKQEIWIHKTLAKLDVVGAMAVGGTFRYVAGMSSLPPKIMESLGLEWLWRVITEPFRLKRIYNAVILFPLKLLRSKLG
jgi:N-acetylglucosaminyldiphosphoundecaprenol N-acetyl-beta-D-mannosaminyltransferase